MQMNIRNAPIKHIHAVTVRMKRRYSMSGTPLQCSFRFGSNTGGTRFQYGWNLVPVRMEPGSSTGGTRFQYGWNPHGLKHRGFADIH